eukprot:TRINITY_DN2462_c0_g1_i3.p1 TRINITY_DN2462_c0_g1~~TRINITY_DN2462_c0_g1_i3.p1  ORF type:complete len:899 (+),score=108.74 TRINITY_DN2462_c0_g1_i3:467-3163(+)
MQNLHSQSANSHLQNPHLQGSHLQNSRPQSPTSHIQLNTQSPNLLLQQNPHLHPQIHPQLMNLQNPQVLNQHPHLQQNPQSNPLQQNPSLHLHQNPQSPPSHFQQNPPSPPPHFQQNPPSPLSHIQLNHTLHLHQNSLNSNPHIQQSPSLHPHQNPESSNSHMHQNPHSPNPLLQQNPNSHLHQNPQNPNLLQQNPNSHIHQNPQSPLPNLLPNSNIQQNSNSLLTQNVQNSHLQNTQSPHVHQQNSNVQFQNVNHLQNPNSLPNPNLPIQNPNIQNPNIQNPNIQNPNIQNPNIQNSNLHNTNIQSPQDTQNLHHQNVNPQGPPPKLNQLKSGSQNSYAFVKQQVSTPPSSGVFTFTPTVNTFPLGYSTSNTQSNTQSNKRGARQREASNPVRPQTNRVLRTDGTVLDQRTKMNRDSIQNIQNRITQVRAQLAETEMPLDRQTAEQISRDIDDISNEITKQIGIATQIESDSVLPTLHYATIQDNMVLLRMAARQLDLYKNEAIYMTRTAEYSTVFAELFIFEQPFPATIKQHLNVGNIQLRLLSGARTSLIPLTPVVTEIVGELKGEETKKTTKRASSPKAKMEGHEENLHQNTVQFDKLKFLIGTNCKPIQVFFQVTVQPYIAEVPVCQRQVIQSPLSEPFVVMTNTKQWSEAQGSLLKSAFFKNQPHNTISLSLFLNLVQHHYIQTSKQTLCSPARPISLDEMEFLLTAKIAPRISPNMRISDSDFNRFWNWYGPILQKIRFYKCLLPMWTRGLFWGLISKESSEHFLADQPIGTFLLRFSVKESGAMAVAYKQSTTDVRHYLMKPTDTLEQGKSLPQFVRECHSLVQFLQIKVDQDLQIVQTNLIDKHVALDKISNKKRKPSPEAPDSYDSTMMDLNMGMRYMSLQNNEIFSV